MAIEQQTASQRITEEVTSWPGVEAGVGRRGELAFTLGRRALGHLHGDRVFHGGFPKGVWKELFDQGRIDYHPVFPGRPGYAARQLDGDADVRDVIELIRLNYDRAVATHGLPGQGSEPAQTGQDSHFKDLHALAPEPLPFAPALDIRAFLLRRDRGNVLVYSNTALDSASSAIKQLGGISRHYLNHSHEALFSSGSVAAPLFVHEADGEQTSKHYDIRGTFSRRHVLDEDFEVIPTPGHTPGATAYLWHSSEHRFLFTGDTIYLDEGEWVAAVLSSSARDAYVASLELIRELDFDVLVPWAATRGEPHYAITDRSDARQRVGAIIERIRRGENH